MKGDNNVKRRDSGRTHILGMIKIFSNYTGGLKNSHFIFGQEQG